MTISHVTQEEGTGGPYFQVVYDLDVPEPGFTGKGTCLLDSLDSFVEILD
jgi:hypothetical protein